MNIQAGAKVGIQTALVGWLIFFKLLSTEYLDVT